jgi:nitrile hydratase
MTNEHTHADAAAPLPARASALERVFAQRGVVRGEAVDRMVEVLTDRSPVIGAMVVAHAWVDADFKQRLLTSPDRALSELDVSGPPGGLVVVENTDDVHNVIVCTLCSCYPIAMLGVPPDWYKDFAYRSRMVREPRVLLGEMGLELAESVEVRVWDSSAEKRYMVLPRRPASKDSLSEEQLAELITRDSMIGVAVL